MLTAYKKQKTLNQIVLRGCLLCFLLPLLIFWAILFLISMNALRNNAFQNQRSVNSLMSASVARELERVEQDLETISLESGFQERMRRLDSLPYGSGLMESYAYLDRLFAQIRTIKNSRYETAYLVTEGGTVYTSSFIPSSEKQEKAFGFWYPMAKEQRGKPTLIGIDYNEKKEPLLVIGRMVLDNERYTFPGAIFLSYPLELFSAPLSSADAGVDSLIMLSGPSAQPYYSNRQPSRELLSGLSAQSDRLSGGTLERVGSQTVFCSAAGDGLQLYVISIPSLSQLYSSLLWEQGGIILLGAVCIALFGVSMLYSYHKLYRPIREILSADTKEKQACEADYDCYELNEINSTISSLIKKNQDGNEEVVRLINHNETVTIDKLQAQINPHFLYNTLTTIKYIALKNGQEEISRVITSLVKLLRGTVNRDGSMIPLAQELDSVRHYICIENAVYNGTIDFSCEVEEVLLPCPVPNFILQPLLENSIFHGIHPEQNGGRIAVKGFERDGMLCIQVTDNGDGFETEKLMQVLSGGGDSAGHMTNLGLKAVHQKIRLLCGSRYGLKIYSQNQQGATIEIILPLNSEGGAVDA